MTKKSKSQKQPSRTPASDEARPIEYKRGWVEFYKLRFKVNEDVLIPRPETELLVDQVIKANPKTVLDIGTGAGNIAISVAKNIPDVQIVATDVSAKALEVAAQNAKLHGVSDKIEFIESNLLADISHQPDIIVTNLPYIPTERIDYLDSSVKDFEPRVALDGGNDGFGLYRELFVQMIQKNLYPKYLIGEIEYTHAEIAVTEAQKYFPNCRPEVKLDLYHRQRFLVIKF